MTSVLWVSKETPDPRGQGGQRRQYHQLRLLADAGVRLTVATLAGSQEDRDLRRLASVHRLAGGRWRGRSGRRTLTRLLARDWDRMLLAHAESLDLVGGGERALPYPWAVDFHNVNSRWFHRAGRPDMVAYWRAVEERILRSAEVCFACSREEVSALRGIHAPARVEVAANGIDPQAWPASAVGSGSAGLTVATFGSWWYPPNQQGLLRFLDAVWPEVRRRHPEAVLRIAGPGAEALPIMSEHGVAAHGWVDDLAAFLGAARVVVVPAVNGPGTPLKFAEALASGSAVVATPDVAAAFPGAPALVGADPSALITHLAGLLADGRWAREVGLACRDFAFAHCRWADVQHPLLGWVAGAGPCR